MISNSLIGSIQIDVPVNPKCPKDSGENHWPEEEGWEGVSQPNPQLVSGLAFTNLTMCSGKPYGGGRYGDIPRKVGAGWPDGISTRLGPGVGYSHVKKAYTHMRKGNG